MKRISLDQQEPRNSADLLRLSDEISEFRDELLAKHEESKWTRRIAFAVDDAISALRAMAGADNDKSPLAGLLARIRRKTWQIGHIASDAYTSMTWARVALATVMLLAVIFTLDLWTGQVVAYRLIYVLPIWLAARLGGTGAGVFAMVLVGSLGSVTDAQFGTDSANQAMNFFVRWIGLGGILITILHIESALKLAIEQATHDPLTGLANRHTIQGVAEQVLLRSKDQLGSIHVAIVDCDNFKKLNDANGHAFGDHALKVLARRLEWATKETGSVARLGGDEFLVIFEGVSRSEAKTTLEKANNGYRKIMASLGAKASMSYGLATYAEDGETLSELCRIADERMYDSKRAVPKSNLAVVQAKSSASRHLA